MINSIEAWCDRYILGDLNKDEMLTLAQYLDSDPHAREAFVQYLTEEAAIGSVMSGRKQIDEMVAELPSEGRYRSVRLGLAAAVLAGFILIGWLVLMNFGELWSFPSERAVATLSTTRDAVWSQSHAGDEGWLYPGTYCLESGTVSFTFDSGAIASVSGPAEFHLESPFGVNLILGEACFFIDEPAQGFKVNTPHAAIKDLGTAFSVLVDDTAGGGSDIHVIEGKVQVVSRKQATPILYREQQSVRVDASGNLGTIDYQGGRMTVPRPHARDDAVPFFHFSLDTRRGDFLVLDQSGFSGIDRLIAQGKRAFRKADGLRLDSGKFKNALHFSGHSGAPAFSLTGGGLPYSYSVAFWAQIPADAIPIESTILEFHDIYCQGDCLSLSWNSDESSGPYGAVRTSYGSGYVVGAMPITDGAWHHIVLCVMGGEKSRLATHMRQYIDCRLDEPSTVRDETIVSNNRGQNVPTFTGFRFATEHPFRGAIDEIFICGRFLLPHEIHCLFQSNSLPFGVHQ